MFSNASCNNCTFFDLHAASGAQAPKDDGLCRFNPPVSQPGPDAHGLWPVVSTDDWCGHFAQGTGSAQVAAE